VLKRFIRILVITWISFVASNINASSTVSNTLTISASVVASCTIIATSLVFGSYTLSLLNATSTVTVTCTNGSVVKIGLNAGTGSGATVATRKMTSNANTLNYSMYQDAGRSVVWGNTFGTNTVNVTGNGTSQVFTIYGQIPANQTSPIGTYSDSVTATVYFQ
jgi:spore coat protein U-like protein